MEVLFAGHLALEKDLLELCLVPFGHEDLPDSSINERGRVRQGKWLGDGYEGRDFTAVPTGIPSPRFLGPV